MTNTTRVSTSRLRDFQYLSSQIGSLVPSYQSTPPEGMLDISVLNTEVKKADWPELYETIGGEEGTTSEYFILPYKANEANLHYYLVGKVLISDTSMSGRIISATFNNSSLDNHGYYTFVHGITHTHPMIQVYDNNNGSVIPSEVINTSGRSKVKILGDFLTSIPGTWTIQAIG